MPSALLDYTILPSPLHKKLLKACTNKAANLWIILFFTVFTIKTDRRALILLNSEMARSIFITIWPVVTLGD